MLGMSDVASIEALRPVPLASVSPGPVFIFMVVRVVDGVKAYKSYAEQVEILRARGMEVDDRDAALDVLRRVNYYRLSGYWYPFRQLVAGNRIDKFYDGTAFSDVVALYEFDERLRAATFEALAPVELAVRAMLGHELGRIDPCVHLEPSQLAVTPSNSEQYARWRKRYESEVRTSREDFVKHHAAKYGGRLPVWAATELMDWGSLSYLYGFAPRNVQERIADAAELTAPQLSSWLKSLNILRNICAHHGRLFNRVHAIVPKLPRRGTHLDLEEGGLDWSRTFGQLTLVRFLSDRLGVDESSALRDVVASYPTVRIVPLSHLGAPVEWARQELWQ